MALEKTPPGVLIAVGVFGGLLLGIVIAVALLTPETNETYDEYRTRMMQEQQMARGGPAGSASRSSGSGSAQRDPHAGAGMGGGADPHGADPHGGASPHGGGADRARQSFAKVHFMKKFVAALTGEPANMFPNPDYEPLLKEGAEPIECIDCHDSGGLNMEAMKANDPGSEAVDPFRRARRGFMIPLMQKWVDRLNTRHRDRLRKTVACTDCHAMDPQDDETRFRVLPPLMVNFVSALKERPKNDNPARDWKPLLKDPSADTMLCGVCHGEAGARMEQRLDEIVGPHPDDFASNRQFMVNLMERWVERLNREAGHLLTKAVVCVDCHDTDPRR